MKGLIRANIRHHGMRYAATILAVTIATAFGVLALSLGNGMGLAVKNAFIGAYASSDVIVKPDFENGGEPLGDVTALVDSIAAVPGVERVTPVPSLFVQVESDGIRSQAQAGDVMEGSTSVDYVEGKEPSAGQIALIQSVARALEVGVGDKVTVTDMSGSGGTIEPEVSGLFGNSGTAMASTSEVLFEPNGLANFSDAAYAEWIQVSGNGLDAPGRDALAQKVRTSIDSEGLSVLSQDEALEQALAEVDSGIVGVNMMVGVFPLIAGIVALIVVTTTFQVIFQQRLRELALLRCLGATKQQVRRMLLGESAVVGIVASLIGVAIGALLGALLTWQIGFTSGYWEALKATSIPSLVGVFLFGTVITIIAGVRPSGRVSSVSPMAALGVAEVPVSKRTTGWWVRLILGAILFVGGAIAMFVAGGQGTPVGFFLAILSGVTALVGAILALSSALPWAVSGLGLVARGVVGQMARGNALRNPGRTAATGIAVVIGVTLIVMMIVGSASLRLTLDKTLDAQVPTDLVVTRLDEGSQTSVTEEDLQTISAIPGVAEAAIQRGISWVVNGELSTGVGSNADDGAFPATLAGEPTSVLEMDPVTKVARTDLPTPSDGQVFVNSIAGLEAGQTVELCIAQTCQDLEVVLVPFVNFGTVGVSSAVLDSASQTAPEGTVQNYAVVAQISNLSDQAQVNADIQRQDSSFEIGGAAQVRAQFESVLGAMLAVVVGLLAVSVLVALVGVSNTLSLSVAERTRENGLLRALGMTKRQLSNMLTLEAVLIAISGAVVGIALGILLGIGGLFSLPLELTHLSVVIPWWQLLAVAAITVLAAMIAAWLPGRRARRVSPVEALASA